MADTTRETEPIAVEEESSPIDLRIEELKAVRARIDEELAALEGKDGRVQGFLTQLYERDTTDNLPADPSVLARVIARWEAHNGR